MFLQELIEEDPQWPTAGNYMYLDMISALRWVKRNIRDYGGDSNNVSIFGQSAGGLSVIDLGAVRGSTGLYRTAISQSGLTSPGSYSAYYNMTTSLNDSKSVVQRLNCTNEDKQKLLACIRNASIDDVFNAYGYKYTRPIIENYFFPLYPPLAIQNGKYNNITLIMGNNDYEQPICYEHPDINYTQAIALISQSVGQQWLPSVIDYYHLNSCSSDQSANDSRCCNIARLILMDKIFDCDIRRIFNAFYSKYGPEYANNKLFAYHLNCYPQCPAVQQFGICRHSSELPIVFGTVSDANSMEPLNCTWDNQTRSFSNGIISEWINIGRTGRPLSDWPYYDPSQPKHIHLTPNQGFVAEEWNRNCSFFDDIELKIGRETFGHDFHI